MRSRRVRGLTALLTATLLVLVSACSGSSGSAKDLDWFFWVGSPGEAAAWQHNAQLVTEKYPNIKVNFSSTSWTGYWQKLPQEASTHSMPCIAGLQFGYVGSVGDQFMPLNTLIKKHHYNLKPFESTMLRELSKNGNILALPYDFGPVVIAYNKSLFQKKGVPLPQAGWTWSQFLQTAQKLTGNGTYGWMPGISNELGYDITGKPQAWVQNGNFNTNNAAYIEGVQKQAELSYKYHVTPPFSTSPNWDPFGQGKVAMEPTGPWSLIDFKESSSFPIGWVQFPTVSGAMHTYNEGSGFGITKDCKNPDAAFKAITVLVDQQAEGYLASRGRAFPARLSAGNHWRKFAGGDAGTVMDNALKNAGPMEVTTNWTQFQTALTQYEPLVLSDKETASKFASDLQSKAGSGKGVSPGNLSGIVPSN
jgi:multiple sugar transport system substrate-binding protein